MREYALEIHKEMHLLPHHNPPHTYAQSEGIELLEQLEPELAHELSQHLLRPESPTARSIAGKVLGQERSREGETSMGAGERALDTSAQEEYTPCVSGEHSEPPSPLKPVPQEFLKPQHRSPTKESEQDQTSSFEEDVCAVFTACLGVAGNSDVKVDRTQTIHLDSVHLMSVLKEHGFTAKQRWKFSNVSFL